MTPGNPESSAQDQPQSRLGLSTAESCHCDRSVSDSRSAAALDHDATHLLLLIGLAAITLHAGWRVPAALASLVALAFALDVIRKCLGRIVDLRLPERTRRLIHEDVRRDQQLAIARRDLENVMQELADYRRRCSDLISRGYGGAGGSSQYRQTVPDSDDRLELTPAGEQHPKAAASGGDVLPMEDEPQAAEKS